jgi:hypothetical protein
MRIKDKQSEDRDREEQEMPLAFLRLFNFSLVYWATMSQKIAPVNPIIKHSQGLLKRTSENNTCWRSELVRLVLF